MNPTAGRQAGGPPPQFCRNNATTSSSLVSAKFLIILPDRAKFRVHHQRGDAVRHGHQPFKCAGRGHRRRDKNFPRALLLGRFHGSLGGRAGRQPVVHDQNAFAAELGFFAEVEFVLVFLKPSSFLP